MPDIGFSAFNNRSFEQFTQALTSNIFGPGILVFGDGPDGGREASIQGTIPYPTPTNHWSGHTVLQAKFRDRPTGDKGDVDWLVGQLRDEAAKWGGQASPPDQYILATNIRLSGVVGKVRKGGQQKLDEAFARHLEPLGVKAMHVWHEQKIATLLDSCPDLFRTYRAWLSPRDVLAVVFDTFELALPKFGETMLRFLQRELREDRSTRMRQAGHVDENSTPLESVFVDLPYQVERSRSPSLSLDRLSVSHAHEGSGRGELAHSILAAASLKLDPVTTGASGQSPFAVPVRHLILGGPGQGKSTITQFLAQVARWRLLRDLPGEKLSPDIQSILFAVGERIVELGLPVEGPARYPLRIDLPTFADELSKSGSSGLSILEYLARQIGRLASDMRITVEVMRQWLGAYPWLLMFDGLDEVPPSSNRREVLRALEEFWDETTPVNADVAVVVTSRPQGYNDDLSPELYLKLEMARLDTVRALAYAERIALRKIPGESQRDRVIGRLREAAANETTALLMVSPLQVGILLQLIDQRGSAPTDRWSLFDDYLGVVVKREQEKLRDAGRVIRERERIIIGLLRRAGLLLHVDAEQRGGSEAYLTTERLETLASDLLAEDGLEGAELEKAAREIVVAATQRLVFLQQRVEGRVEFEVRSLQEFMAAAELMAGNDGEVTARLREIAGRTHWQHVYRIAASKAFAIPDANKYRDTIVAINREIDAERPGALCVARGAATALDLLADGIAHDQPRYRKPLALHAFTLCALGPDHVDRRLTNLVLGLDEEFARKALAGGIASGRRQERLACWALLFRATAVAGDWIDRLVAEWWPAERQRLSDVLACGTLPCEETGAATLYEAALLAISPAEVRKAVGLGTTANDRQHRHYACRRFPFLLPVVSPGDGPNAQISLLPDADTGIEFKLVTPEASRRSAAYEHDRDGPWSIANPVNRFVREPSCEALAAVAEALVHGDLAAYLKYATVPWMLETLAEIVGSGLSPQDAATMARNGAFGDPSSWAEAEKRWIEMGVVQADLDVWETGIFFDERVASVGAPRFASITLHRRDPTPTDQPWLAAMVPPATATDAGPLLFLRHLLRFVLHRPSLPGRLSARECLLIAAPDPMATFKFVDASILANAGTAALADQSLIDAFAAIGSEDAFSIMAKECADVRAIAIAMARSAPELPGLLTLVLATAAREASMIVAVAEQVRDLVAKAPGRPGAVESTLAALSLALGVMSARDVAAVLVRADEQALGQYAALELCSSDDMSDEDATALLSALITNLDDGAGPVRSRSITQLRQRLDRQTAKLSDPDCWERLGLPSSLFSALNRHVLPGPA